MAGKPIWQDLETVTVPFTSGSGQKGTTFDAQGRTHGGIAIDWFEGGEVTSVDLFLELSHDKQTWFDLHVDGSTEWTLTLISDINASPSQGSLEGIYRPFVTAGDRVIDIPAEYWRLRIDPSSSPATNVSLRYALVAFG